MQLNSLRTLYNNPFAQPIIPGRHGVTRIMRVMKSRMSANLRHQRAGQILCDRWQSPTLGGKVSARRLQSGTQITLVDRLQDVTSAPVYTEASRYLPSGDR